MKSWKIDAIENGKEESRQNIKHSHKFIIIFQLWHTFHRPLLQHTPSTTDVTNFNWKIHFQACETNALNC